MTIFGHFTNLLKAIIKEWQKHNPTRKRSSRWQFLPGEILSLRPRNKAIYSRHLWMNKTMAIKGRATFTHLLNKLGCKSIYHIEWQFDAQTEPWSYTQLTYFVKLNSLELQ